jgi:hypothetical protein
MPHVSDCASDKTIQVDEHFDTVSFFWMDCEHTWNVRVPQTAGALLSLASPHPAGQQRPRRSGQTFTYAEAIRRATATVARAGALMSIAADLLRLALFTQRRRALIHGPERMVH